MIADRNIAQIVLFAAMTWIGGSALAESPSPAAASAKLSVGLRRSSYGLRGKNADDAWWVARAKEYAAEFPGAQPVIIEIVSGYLGDGSTEFGFAKPKEYVGPTDRMSFVHGKLDHERALSAYDAAGVQAIIQFEPGDVDILRCLEIAQLVLGRHKCVVGYGIDAEWYRTRESKDQTGIPVPDAEARAWLEKAVSLGKDYSFFIKHFDPRHLPPTFRHPQLWFLDDSQEFADRAEFLSDFKAWARFCDGSQTGYQFGYPADRKWWSQIANPPLELGTQIHLGIPSCRYLFWVDFTADKVRFGE